MMNLLTTPQMAITYSLFTSIFNLTKPVSIHRALTTQGMKAATCSLFPVPWSLFP